ncbi:MAG: hypothetical protein M3N19_03095 [Candidatus Eremiobacteraeota bacterium]|nr:hypothetical protein [Candidatus Eremiobacteraeota bacterium]
MLRSCTHVRYGSQAVAHCEKCNVALCRNCTREDPDVIPGTFCQECLLAVSFTTLFGEPRPKKRGK